jgi:hypothetical protein
MTKTEIDYIDHRISNVMRCVNGQITMKLTKLIKNDELTTAERITQIRTGKATLLSNRQLESYNFGYHDRNGFAVVKCFTYNLSDKQKKAAAFNKRLKSKENELHDEVQLAGKRLLDEIVMGIYDKKDLPKKLIELSKMSELAVM